MDEGAAIAVISFAVLEIFRTYQSTAPKLTDIRKARKDDWLTAQQILDADVMTGLLVVVMGIAGVVLMRNRWPLVFLIGTWLLVMGYYHAVRRGPSDWREIV
jgi:hypothetical protein